MSPLSLKVVVAVTSPVAFESLEKNSILATSFSVAHAFSVETGISTHLAIALEDLQKHQILIAKFLCVIQVTLIP